jgi:hypothetical protein
MQSDHTKIGLGMHTSFASDITGRRRYGISPENRQPGMRIMCGYAVDGVRFWHSNTFASGKTKIKHSLEKCRNS